MVGRGYLVAELVGSEYRHDAHREGEGVDVGVPYPGEAVVVQGLDVAQREGVAGEEGREDGDYQKYPRKPLSIFFDLARREHEEGGGVPMRRLRAAQ